jgi:hypothetical protein
MAGVVNLAGHGRLPLLLQRAVEPRESLIRDVCVARHNDFELAARAHCGDQCVDTVVANVIVAEIPDVESIRVSTEDTGIGGSVLYDRIEAAWVRPTGMQRVVESACLGTNMRERVLFFCRISERQRHPTSVIYHEPCESVTGCQRSLAGEGTILQRGDEVIRPPEHRSGGVGNLIHLKVQMDDACIFDEEVPDHLQL